MGKSRAEVKTQRAQGKCVKKKRVVFGEFFKGIAQMKGDSHV
jgi:hypothetical protein